MKRNITTFFITLSLLLSLTSWRAFTSRAASGQTGAGQQVGEPFRVPAIAAGRYHSLALKSDGSVIAWGENSDGQTTVPSAAQSGVTAIAGGGYHCLALKSDSSVIAWGRKAEGQTNVPSAAQSGVTAIAAGNIHSLALKSDGSVIAWGSNNLGQTNVPSAAQSGVTAIAAGSNHNLALKSDGSVVAWGDNGAGQTTVPSAAQSGVTAIAANYLHSLALKSDGSVIAWGSNGRGQATVPSAAQSDVTAIAAGYFHSLALKSDGSVIAWGENSDGQTTVPAGLSSGSNSVVAWGRNTYDQTNVPAGLSGVTALAGGGNHSLALKSNGSVVAWGYNGAGQTTVPAGLSGVTAIAAGGFHNLALKSDGSVVAWGNIVFGQTNVPAGLSGVTAIAAGLYHSLALKSDGSLVGWGLASEGQTTVPAGLSGVSAIAAGTYHNLALSVVNNTAPSLTLATVTQTAGTTQSGVTLATVQDAEDAENTLSITVNGGSNATVNGVKLSNLSVDSSGNVTATLNAACNATTATFNLRVTDSGGRSATGTLTVTVTSNPPPVLSYNNQTVNVGTTPSFSPASGPSDNVSLGNVTLSSIIPNTGLSLSVNPATGMVSVTGATLAGSYDVVISVADNCNAVATAPFKVNVTCPTITVGTPTGAGALGVSYSSSVAASPPAPSGFSYQYSLANGTTLPPGLMLNASTGALTGTPSASGTFSFDLKAELYNTSNQATGCSNTQTRSISVTCTTFTVGTPNAAATVGQSYNSTASATPSAPSGFSYRYSLANNTTLPAGLTLNANTGAITGTPTVSGNASFAIKAELFNSSNAATECSDTQTRSINVSCPSFTVGTPSSGTVGVSYSSSVATSPATSAGFSYQYSLANNTLLPSGLTLDTGTGAITGTPTINSTFSFSIKAELFNGNLSTGCSDTQTRSINVTCPTITINPASVPNGGVGLAYPTTTFTAAGGVAPHNFSLSQGTLPTGLKLSGATLSGTPTQGGTFNFTLTATDAYTCTGSRNYTLSINRPPVLAPIGNKTVTLGQTLSFAAMAADPDQASSLSYSLAGAPAGATLNPMTGQFSWTLTIGQWGLHTFTVVVADNGTPQLAASETITVNVVNLPPTLTLSVSYSNINPTSAGLSAQLKDSFTNVPLPSKLISFTIGTQTVTGTTDGNGVALGQISVGEPGTYVAKATFAGDAQYPLALAVTSFNVTLTGRSCTFTRALASQSFAANGGTGTVALITPAGNCNWSAASTVPWITLTSGLSGTGNGTVSYTVAANPTTAPRSGTINLAGLTFTVAQGGQFNDVPVGHPFYEFIGKLAARGVTLGCGGGNYCPDALVTREQMAAFLLRSLGDFNPPTPATQRFLDVPPSNAFYAFIEQMAVRGITQGCGGGNYCPSQNVTREAMAAFLIRALHAPGYVPPTPALQRFLDVPPASPFYGYIDELAERGITLGCGGGNYCPAASVTRGQMAVFLVRAFNL